LTPVRIGVVGLGYWGPQLVRNLVEAPFAELVWVCDSREEARLAVTRRYPSVPSTGDFDALLNDSTLDAIVVATPIGTHYDLARRSLESGKHTFVEKPLAGSLREAGQLVATADRLGLVLMPGHTFLYSPPVQTICELIRSRELGDVYFISSSRVNLGLHQSDASVIWDLGPHDFSILSYWLGETPTYVTALSRSCVIPTTPDVAFINLEYASGIIAHVELSWLAPSKLRRTTVVGSQKMVVYDDTSNEPVRIFDSGVDLPTPGTFGEYRLTYRTGDILSPRVEVAEPLSLELQDFCSAIRSGSPLRSSSRVGLDVVRIVEAAEQSLAQGGARLKVGEPAIELTAAGSESSSHPGPA
jgi:predicted dehydrogenase